MGIPEHLRKEHILHNLCKSFGFVVIMVDNSKNKDKVLINIMEYKGLNILIVAPLWDKDVVFPVCFRLALDDLQEKASCPPEGSVGIQQRGIRRMSWAEVVTSNYSKQQDPRAPPRLQTRDTVENHITGDIGNEADNAHVP